MGRPPTRSPGCLSCKRMKVKCDGATPECRRCVRAGRSCPGYPNRQQLHFRSMNTWAAAKVAPHGVIEHLERPEAASEAASLTCARPSTPWEQHATSYFVDNFTTSAWSGGPGYLEFLPEILKSPFECLQEALLAVSFAALGNVSRMPNLQTRSKVHYGKALRTLSSALKEESLAVAAEEILATIILIQKFEVVSGTATLCSPHDAAVVEIMRQRWATRPRNRVGSGIYRTFQSRLAIQAVCEGLNEDVNEEASRSSLHKSSLWPMLRRVSLCRWNIQQSMKKVVGTSKQPRSVLEDALQQSTVTYNQLAAWPDSVPEQWKYRDFQSPGVDSPDPRISLFSSIQHAAAWMMYWCACIHLLQSLEEGYSLLHKIWRYDDHTEGVDRVPRAQLLEAVDQVLACAPFMMGDVGEDGDLKIGEKTKTLGAFFLLRGLLTVNSVNDIRPQQRQTVLDYMDRIGTTSGIKAAIHSKNSWLASHHEEAMALESL